MRPASLNPDIRGLIYLIAAVLSFISLYSFRYLDPRSNGLGYLGYIAALSVEYLFGLGSYLLPCYLFWLGIRYLSQQKLTHVLYDHLYFLILLASTSFLLTIAAESFQMFASSWEDRVISEIHVLHFPYPRTLIRRNLGGVPFYFLYADMPGVNLQRVLSPVGCVLVFASLGLVSFFLLTRLRFVKGVFFGWQAICKTAVFFRQCVCFLWKKEKKEQKRGAKKVIAQILESKPIELKREIAPRPIVNVKKEPVSILTKSLIVHTGNAFTLPSPNLLSCLSNKIDPPALKKDLMHQAAILEETLKSFGIEAKVGEINSGPTITSFEVHPSIGVKVQKIKTLESDIALNMQAKSIRIIAPIPGKAAVGVEVPAIHPQEVNFREMLLHYQQNYRKLHIPILLGKAVNGDWVFSDLARMPHLLIAGATGSGKSVCINTIVMSILMNARPEETKLLMIDPKKVELTQYSQLPHMIAPVITEPHGAYAALQWLVKEMQTRYDILKQLGLRNVSAFNSRKINAELEASLNIAIPPHMPYIIAIVDEFADLMMVSSADLETPIARIAQMARAVGIHLILATQRPSREVITGIIKANIPTRISFKVASRINSQIILDDIGAESLLGNGDLLFLPPGTSQLVRAQGAYLSDEDINQIIQYLGSQGPPQYLIPSFDALRSFDLGENEETSKGKDPLYDQALTIILGGKNASTTFLQRKLKIGYARAASLMDELEENGIIGPQEGARPRRVIAPSQMALLGEEESEE
ncbi:MAG TPA: DNA translocase FtsK 4TM domain-containing protein [Chlamydiales bacterium]|nr:DNA translocase FtsK 4TM domain-containing protein [Chlamydiales bacterium]